MEKLKILIVEDEMIIAESISDMLEELGYDVTDICIRAKQALEKINANPPDLALFDIQLKGEETGIWLGEQIKDKKEFPFIFLTSYGDKATIDQAVGVSPYGYLLKPVEKQHLYGAIEVAMQRFLEGSKSGDGQRLTADDSFFIKEDHQYVKIKISDISYVKADDNYLEIYCGEKRHIMRSTLREFYAKLPDDLFMQVHRSFLVALSKVSAFSNATIELGDIKIPVSKQYREAIQQYFKVI